MSETTVTRKWSSTAGPVQTKRVQKALSAIGWEGRTYTEKSGVIGGEEYTMHYTQICGGQRPEAETAWLTLGERFAWTITRANYQEIITAAAQAVQDLIPSRQVIDKREDASTRAARLTEQQKATAEREAKQAERDAQAQVLAAELRKQYPWAQPHNDTTSDYVRAAINLKTELSKAFRGVAFSCRTDGRDSIRVSWTLGPTTREVESLSDKYRCGSFDGMTDSFDYDHSAEGEAHEIVLGRVRYVSFDREIPQNLQIEVGQMICAVTGTTWGGMETRGIREGDEDENLWVLVRRVFDRTSIPPGARILSVRDALAERTRFSEGMSAKYGDGWAAESKRGLLAPEDLQQLLAYVAEDNAEVASRCPQTGFELEIEAPATLTDEQVGALTMSRTGENGNTVARNVEHDGVEISFAAKPSDTLMRSMKAKGFRCTRRPPWRWYKRFTPTAWEDAHVLAGLDPQPLPEVAPGPDRFDMAVEDMMCQQAQA